MIAVKSFATYIIFLMIFSNMNLNPLKPWSG